MFTAPDAAHALVWAFWMYYTIAHRSPWGYWGAQRSRAFVARRAATGNVGPSAAGYGTLWLLVPLLPASAAFYFFREFEAVAAQGALIAAFVAMVAASVFVKLQQVLFFDYQLWTAAAWMAAMAASFNGAALGLVGSANAWAALGLLAGYQAWLLYMLYVSVRWRLRFGKR